MYIPDINSVFEISPPVFIGGISNRTLPREDMVYFRTRGIPMQDKEELDRQFSLLMTTKNPEERLKEKSVLDYALARKKFVSVENYWTSSTDGGQRQVTDFDDFCKVAPAELVSWYFDVIQYGEKLSAAEVRNFLQVAVSPYGSQYGEAVTNGTVPTVMQNAGKTETAAI